MPLTAAEADEVRRLLAAERAATASRLAGLEASHAEMVAAADLEPPDDEHDPDGTTAYERAQVASLAAEARAHLAALDAALARGDDLGTCTACGGPVGLARLRAVPAASRCIACAAAGR